MNKFLSVLFILLVFFSCKKEEEIPSEIKEITVAMTVKRFDKEFAVATLDDISLLKDEYPYLLSDAYPDAYWEQKIRDTIQQEINEEVTKAFPDFQQEQENLENLFRHIKYYYPETVIPDIITITNEVNYRNKVVLADSLLVISLDTYLGKDHHFYVGIPKFQSKNFRKEQIDVDVAAAFAKAKTLKPENGQLLSQMIYEGKQLYMMEQLLSKKPLNEVLGYTEQELLFAQENERNIWEYFISNEVLYSTDRKMLSRFIDPAPFSKFYLAFDNETPGRIGRYIGYKIIKSFMDKNDVALKSMLLQDADAIFAAAKYKP